MSISQCPGSLLYTSMIAWPYRPWFKYSFAHMRGIIDWCWKESAAARRVLTRTESQAFARLTCPAYEAVVFSDSDHFAFPASLCFSKSSILMPLDSPSEPARESQSADVFCRFVFSLAPFALVERAGPRRPRVIANKAAENNEMGKDWVQEGRGLEELRLENENKSRGGDLKFPAALHSFFSISCQQHFVGICFWVLLVPIIASALI